MTGTQKPRQQTSLHLLSIALPYFLDPHSCRNLASRHPQFLRRSPSRQSLCQFSNLDSHTLLRLNPPTIRAANFHPTCGTKPKKIAINPNPHHWPTTTLLPSPAKLQQPYLLRTANPQTANPNTARGSNKDIMVINNQFQILAGAHLSREVLISQHHNHRCTIPHREDQACINRMVGIVLADQVEREWGYVRL